MADDNRVVGSWHRSRVSLSKDDKSRHCVSRLTDGRDIDAIDSASCNHLPSRVSALWSDDGGSVHHQEPDDHVCGSGCWWNRSQKEVERLRIQFEIDSGIMENKLWNVLRSRLKILKIWTSLEETVKCSQDKNRLFQLKSQIFEQIDRKIQLKVFGHLRDLMRKAVGIEGKSFG